MASYRRYFWALQIPIATLAYLGTTRCVRGVVKPLDTQVLGQFLVSRAVHESAPEPQEQLSYLLSVVFLVTLIFAFTLLLKWLGVFTRPEPSGAWLNLFAFPAQLALLAVGTEAAIKQAAEVSRYRFLDVNAAGGAALVVALVLAYARLSVTAKARLRCAAILLSEMRWFPWTLAALWILCFTITSAYRGVEQPSAPGLATHHLPFTMGEFAGPLNGRTPLVNFFAQYNNVLPLVLKPVFKIVGLNFTTFTVTMCVTSTFGILFLFAALTRVCQSAWTALTLFVPLMPMSFYTIEEMSHSGYANTAFNYYAVGPMRYLNVFVLAWVAVFYLERPSLRRLATAGAASLLVALNNLDFGIPSAAGVLACVLLFPPRFGRAALATRIVYATLVYVTAALAAFGVCVLALRLHAGTWPLLGLLTHYQQAYARLGLSMRPLPSVGLYWVIYLTAISALFIAIFETFSASHENIAKNRRLLNGSLAFSGVSLIGVLMYYVGRSHPYVLVATYCSWAYLAVQLLYRAYLEWRDQGDTPQSSRGLFGAIPTVSVCALVMLFVPVLRETPNPVTQLFRLRTKTSTDPAENTPEVDFICKHVRPGASTVIAGPNAHWLALQADVRNLYPFAHSGSLTLHAQVDAAMATVAQLPSDGKVFLDDPPAELQTRLEENGFQKTDSAGNLFVMSRLSDRN